MLNLEIKEIIFPTKNCLVVKVAKGIVQLKFFSQDVCHSVHSDTELNEVAVLTGFPVHFDAILYLDA